MFGLPVQTWERLGLWLVVGPGLYFPTAYITAGSQGPHYRQPTYDFLGSRINYYYACRFQISSEEILALAAVPVVEKHES